MPRANRHIVPGPIHPVTHRCRVGWDIFRLRMAYVLRVWVFRHLPLPQKTRRHTATPAHLRLGEWGEAQAADYLRQHGMKILDTRVRMPRGKEELDLVAREQDVLVFVEVKTRSDERRGRPFAAVNRRKRHHLARAGLAYWRRLPQRPRYFRFDVVEVVGRPGNTPPVIRHIRNAFTLPRSCRVSA